MGTAYDGVLAPRRYPPALLRTERFLPGIRNRFSLPAPLHGVRR